jgi:hypothetical protein
LTQRDVHILECVKRVYDLKEKHYRREVLSMVAEIYTLENFHSIGMNISRRTLDNSIKHAQKYGPGAPVPKPQMPPSRRPKDEKVKSEIVKFLNGKSKPCPSRFAVIKSSTSGKKFKKTVRELEGIFFQQNH